MTKLLEDCHVELSRVPADLDELRPGDRVRVYVGALWRDRPTAWRTVRSNEVNLDTGTRRLTVRLGGCADYQVRSDEVLDTGGEWWQRRLDAVRDGWDGEGEVPDAETRRA